VLHACPVCPYVRRAGSPCRQRTSSFAWLFFPKPSPSPRIRAPDACGSRKTHLPVFPEALWVARPTACLCLQVRDLRFFNITFVPYTNGNVDLIVPSKDVLARYKEYWALPEVERLQLLEQLVCPARPEVFNPTCTFHWVHLHSNLVVNLTELEVAVREALLRVEQMGQHPPSLSLPSPPACQRSPC
jgi:hypothetical protein